jgi:type I restriction enzyme S subunit
MLGEFIEQIDVRNSDCAFGEDSVIGISTQKSFIFTKADLSGVSLTSYKKVQKNCFVYVPDTSRRGDKMALAYNTSEKIYLVSAIYTVFRVKENSNNILLPEYLFLYFNRSEFDRYTRFHSWGSAREVFSWDDMCNIEIDLPPVHIQKKYADVYSSIIKNQNLRDKIKNICSVLVKGAVGEVK